MEGSRLTQPVVRDVDFDTDGHPAGKPPLSTLAVTFQPTWRSRQSAPFGFWGGSWILTFPPVRTGRKDVIACLPRSSFPAGLEPGTSGPGVHIEITSDRLGIPAYSGKTSLNAEW